jgi:hypothetical protein
MLHFQSAIILTISHINDCFYCISVCKIFCICIDFANSQSIEISVTAQSTPKSLNYFDCDSVGVISGPKLSFSS